MNFNGKLQSIILLALIIGSALIQTNIIKAEEASYQFSLKWMHPDPYFIDVDSDGNVYVASRNNHNIIKYDSNGNVLKTWGSYGPGNGQFNDPEGIAVDSINLLVYVTDCNNHRIQRFDLDGSFLGIAGSYGSGDGEFINPAGIAVDKSGNIYIADRENDRIQKGSADGAFLFKWGRSGHFAGEFNSPESIAVDSLGHVYVGDEENNRVQKFNSTGNFVSYLGKKGSEATTFIDPEDVCVDKYDNVYVSDSDSRIQKFTSTGEYITTIGSEGTEDGKFKDPRGVVVDVSGNLYVADTGNHRIQKFTPATGVLHLRILDQDGTPVSDADVSSTSQPNGQQTLQDVTDVDGNVEFTGILPGPYMMQAQDNGHIIGTQSADVVAGSRTNSIITQTATGGISIIVMDMNSNLIEGATVKMYNGPTDQEMLSGPTGSDGRANFALAKPGSYQFNASMPGFATSFSAIFTVSEGATAEALINLSKERPPTLIIVKVKESSGAPIVGADVRNTPAAAGAWAYSGRTNSSGVLLGVSEVGGDTTIQVSKAGYGTKSYTIYVTLEQTHVVNVVLLPLPSVKVTVIDTSTSRPLAGASVSSTLQRVDESPLITDSSGKASFNGVNPGSYTIKVTLAGFTTVTTGVFTIDYGDVEEITILMEKPVAIKLLRIIIVDGDGQPADGVKLTFTNVPAGQGLLEGGTNNAGICEFVDVKLGDYNIEVKKDGYEIRSVNGSELGYHDNSDIIAYFKIVHPETTEVRIVLGTGEPLNLIEKLILYFTGSGTGTPCIIVTATYGTPYAPEVVYMRHVRDDLIGSNDVGKVLVSGWNRFYYLWSPPIAYSISDSSQLRSTFTVLLLPLLGSMHVVAFVFESIVAFSPELASVISFLTAAVMATTIYIILPIILLRALLRRIIRNSQTK